MLFEDIIRMSLVIKSLFYICIYDCVCALSHGAHADMYKCAGLYFCFHIILLFLLYTYKIFD